MSRTQVSPDMITHLCKEIRNIKRESLKRNNIKVLPVVPNNTPDQSDKYEGDALDDEGTASCGHYFTEYSLITMEICTRSYHDKIIILNLYSSSDPPTPWAPLLWVHCANQVDAAPSLRAALSSMRME